VFVGRSVGASIRELRGLVRAFTRSVKAPASTIELTILRASLVELSIAWSTFVHARLHLQDNWTCAFVSWKPFLVTDSGRTVNPSISFRAWALTFLADLERAHRPSPERRAADWIERHYQQTIPLGRLAKLAGMSPGGLRKAFTREFGVSPHEYQTNVRLARVLDLLDRPGSKVDQASLEVGWRSKKNLYRAVERLTGGADGTLRSTSTTVLRRLLQESASRRLAPSGRHSTR
jgi:AraC-like DNA-binding protein